MGSDIVGRQAMPYFWLTWSVRPPCTADIICIKMMTTLYVSWQ